MKVANFIANYISNELRTGRDFSGARGWFALINLCLKQFERRGYFTLDRTKEVGVEVNNSYWITIPSDCREVLRIYDPEDWDDNYNFEIVNGKIKLSKEFEKNDSPDSYTLSSLTESSVKINEASAMEDEWLDYLLVASDGNRIISGNSASIGGLSTLTFLHEKSIAVPYPTTGYLTDIYLVMRYMSTYTGVTSVSDEIPIDDRFEDVLAQALVVNAMSKQDKRYVNEARLYMNLIDEIESELFSPSEKGITPRARPLIGYEDYEDYGDSEYIGDE